MDHVKRVAGYVRQTYGVNVIIWDDMLRNFMPEEMEPLADIVQVSISMVPTLCFPFLLLVHSYFLIMHPLIVVLQPMVWVYADDVYRFFPSYNWDKLSKVFDSVWTAGAFKGTVYCQQHIPTFRST